MGYDGSLKFDTKVNTSGFETGVSKISTLAKTGLKVTAGIIGGVTTALVGMAGAAVNVGSDFEAGMSKVQAISGATADELEQLTDKAAEMGRTTKFTATEASEALSYMAMAGWKTNDMLDGLEGIMNLAAASGEDLATTSDIVTDALTAFGLSAKDSTHFADVLAAASSNANTNVGMMGETFKYVAPVAGALGYSVEDVGVAIGLMANSGIKASTAGTTLRSILTRMVSPTKQSAIAMDRLGISIKDSSGNVKPLNVLMKELRKEFGDLSEAEKAELASNLAGQRGMSGLLAIVNASEEDFNKLTEAIADSDGAAKDMAETMQNNLKGKLTRLKSAAEGLGIAFYNHISGPMGDVVEDVIDGVARMTEAMEEEDGLAGTVEVFGEIFSELAVKAAQAAPELVRSAVSLIKAFVKGIKDHKEELKEAARELVNALADGIIELLPSAIGGPLKGIIDQIAKSFENGGLKHAIDTVVTLFNNLIEVVGKIISAVGPTLVSIIDFIGNHFEIILPIVSGVFAAFMAYQAVTGVISAVQTAMSALNTVMAANPYLLVIGLIVGLTAALVTYTLAVDDTAEAERELARADGELAGVFSGMADDIGEFQKKIQSADSHFGEFTDDLFRTDDEIADLKQSIDETQKGITEILRVESGKRKVLTDDEIKKLEEYYDTLNDLYAEQLKIEQEKQNAVLARIKAETEAFDGSLNDYERYQAEWLKTARESHDEEIALLDQQYTVEFSLRSRELDKRKDLTEKEKKAELDAVIDKYDKLREEADSHYSEISTLLVDKYAEISGANRDFTKEMNRISQDMVDAEASAYGDLWDRYDEAVEHNLRGNQSYVDAMKWNKQRYEEYCGDIAALDDEMVDLLSGSNARYAANLLATAAETTTNGAKLTDAQADLIGSLTSAWHALPENSESRAQVLEVLSEASSALADTYSDFKVDAQLHPDALIKAWEKFANENSIVSDVQALTDSTKGVIEGSQGEIFEVSRRYFNGVGDGMEASDAGARALEAAAHAVGMTIDEVESKKPEFQRIAQEFADSGALGFTTADLQSTFGNEAAHAVSIANSYLDSHSAEMWTAGNNVGKQIDAGIKDGIDNNIDKPKSAIKTLAKNLPIWAKNELEIQSPSKVFEKQVGKYVDEGLAKGIENNDEAPLKAIKKMVKKVLSAAQSTLQIQSPSRVFADEIGRWIPPGIGKGIDKAMPALIRSTKADMEQLTRSMSAAVKFESGTITIEKTGRMEYEASLAERLAQHSVDVSGVVENDTPMEIHTHVILDKREVAKSLTPEINYQLYKIEKAERRRGVGDARVYNS